MKRIKNSSELISHLTNGLPHFDILIAEGVSHHVQELLDNLKDSRHSLRGLQDSGLTERPRAGVYSSPMPLISRRKPDGVGLPCQFLEHWKA